MRFSVLAALLAATISCGGPPAPASLGTPAVASAHPIRSETVEYQDGTALLEGYLAYPTDGDASAKRPGILVFHDWMGLGSDSKRRADQLAALGYVAFAGDVYGKGVRPANGDEAGKLAGRYKSDRASMRTRGEAALQRLLADARVDPAKVVAIGYCFGGTEALELARDGASLAGVVTFHGGLSSPHPEDGKKIKARVLVLHGGDDPHVKPDEVLAFEDEMRQAHVDWQLITYGGAVHAFTIQSAGDDPSKGAAYDAKADARSWSEMQRFFAELFRP